MQGKPFIWGRHIDVMASHLQAVTERRINRLLINVPPGCTKSTIVSVLWPSWVWARDPTESFMCISYHADLTERDSVACRELIGSEWYQSRWGHKVTVRFGEDSKTFYRLTNGGWRLGTTRRGRTTGDHPSNVIIDDPISAEQAKNPNERKAFVNYYRDSLSTRGAANRVRHVCAMQRLHVEDPSAEFLRDNRQADLRGEAQPWVHCRLPMRYDPILAMRDCGFGGDWRTEPGQLLYPELLDEERVRELERNLGTANTNAQLQQNPQIRDGDFFALTKLVVIPRKEVPLRFDSYVRFWDRAATEGGDGACTVGALMARKGDRFFLLDVIRKRIRSAEVENLIEQTVILDEIAYGKDRLTTCFEIEGGSGGVRQAEITQNRLRGHRVFGVPSRESKAARAEPLSIAIENGEVFVLEAAYLPELFEEMQSFPTGSTKDQVDAFAGAYLELVNPTSKAATIVISERDGDAASAARASDHGKCRNTACSRPAFSPDGYCCGNCRTADAEGLEPHKHTPECSASYNDWWVKRK